MSARRTAGRRAPKEMLLQRAIDYLTTRGLSDLSLRRLAAALGTSHRMLIYHFGSKEGMLVEVVRAVETRQREALAHLVEPGSRSLSDVARAFWGQLSDPALAPYERLFFEIYGQALQGRSHAVPLLEGIVDSWLAPGTALLMVNGLAEQDARAEARLSLAVIRGLLLDLLATGDLAGANEAFERYLIGFDARCSAGTANAG
jgi:AcrR family transcriptional regulator